MNDFDWFTLFMLSLALGLNYRLDALLVHHVLPEVRLARTIPQCLQRVDTFRRAHLAVNLVWLYQWVIGGAQVLMLILLWESGRLGFMLLVGVFLGINMLHARRVSRHRAEVNV